MKKLVITIGILCGLILLLWVAGRVTGALQYYKIPTPSNEPTVKVGEHVLASNFKKPSPGCFIVFTSRYEDSINATYMQGYKPGAHYLYRLCGMSGNILEMKNAVLYVNGRNFDEGLSLKNEFMVSSGAFTETIEEDDKIALDNYRPGLHTPDSMVIAFDKTQIKKYQSKLKLTPYIIRDTSVGPFKWMNKNTIWTPDNFGPLTIPAGCYFGLGDNRHNALDSRFTGFIKAADIKGVVLNK